MYFILGIILGAIGIVVFEFIYLKYLEHKKKKNKKGDLK